MTEKAVRGCQGATGYRISSKEGQIMVVGLKAWAIRNRVGTSGSGNAFFDKVVSLSAKAVLDWRTTRTVLKGNMNGLAGWKAATFT